MGVVRPRKHHLYRGPRVLLLQRIQLRVPCSSTLRVAGDMGTDVVVVHGEECDASPCLGVEAHGDAQGLATVGALDEDVAGGLHAK